MIPKKCKKECIKDVFGKSSTKFNSVGCDVHFRSKVRLV
jgi:hypothetical protein